MGILQKICILLGEFNSVSVFFRLTLSMICGGLIGLDRGKKQRAAGFRTHMLVCLGATLTMLISQYIVVELGQGTDLTRFGAQVINGIGFLGAGTIVVSGNRQVKGLTTAAGLWASACMGLAIGAGFYLAAILSCALILLVITLLTRFQVFVMKNARDVNVYVEYREPEHIGRIISVVREANIRVYDVEITKAQPKNGILPSIVLSVRLPKKYSHSDFLSMLSDIEGVATVEEL